MLLDYIIISCCTRFQEGRSISAVYHLLKGKRSIQTVQDSHIYHLNHFYGIYPGLQKWAFDNHIKKLISNDMLELNHDNAAMPTDAGKQWFHRETNWAAVQYFNGMAYYQKAPVFLERLLLLVQTITNTREQNYHFIPVIDKPAVTQWVKRQYQKLRHNQSVFLNQLYEELYQLLQSFPEKEANMFVDSLSGYNHYGMSSFQLADHYGMQQIDIPLVKTAMIHHMLSIISEDSAAYPLFTRFLNELPQESQITNSASKTKTFLNEQYSLEDIAAVRHLKLNTIYDHMVEIALHDDDFPIEDYVTAHEQSDILSAVNSTSSYKLKTIKEKVSDSISYFQIRLVLALSQKS